MVIDGDLLQELHIPLVKEVEKDIHFQLIALLMLQSLSLLKDILMQLHDLIDIYLINCSIIDFSCK